MAEQLPPDDHSLNEPHQLDAGDNPPEPDNASIRAERGSPTPSSVTVDLVPSLPDVGFSSSASLQDPFPNNEFPEVPPVPSAPASISDPEQPTSSNAAAAVAAINARRDHPVDPQLDNIDQGLLSHLLELGFDEFAARLSLVRTANHSLEAAIDWITERSNLSDYEEGSSSGEEEEETEEGGASMGAATSTGGRTHKMVLVANMSLKMANGKMAAQVGHATLGVYRLAMNSDAGQAAVNSWTRHGQVKIVVRGQSTEQLMELHKQAKDAGCYSYLVQDAGYTQVPPGSRTVLGVFGTVEQVDSVTGTLKLL